MTAARQALRRAAPRSTGGSAAAWLALVLLALAPPGAAQQSDVCTDPAWTLAGQAASGVYNAACTALNVRPRGSAHARRRGACVCGVRI